MGEMREFAGRWLESERVGAPGQTGGTQSCILCQVPG